MKPRHELKYFFATREVPYLTDRLGRLLTLDRHAGPQGEYMIRSAYFDDAYDSAYHDKLDGVASRDKYRIRVYRADEGQIFLERKRKMGDMIEKTGVHITRRLAENLLAGEVRGLEKMEEPLLRDMFVAVRTRLLRPVVIVDYERIAYLHPAEHTRVTIDRRVRALGARGGLLDFSLPAVPAVDPAYTILEVKYDAYLPDFIPPVLSQLGADRSAISKYVLCRQRL